MRHSSTATHRTALLSVLLLILASCAALLAGAPAARATATPSWWTGTCDSGRYPGSYPLGASYNGVQACGPGPYQGGHDVAVQFFPGAWSVYEWECVELVMRYMYLVYGVAPYQANGNTVVSNYSGSRLTKVTNPSASGVPSPGDILSLSGNNPNGHTAVVTAVNLDSSGNGTLTTMEENNSANGVGSIPVSNNVVGGGVLGWLHDPVGRSVASYAFADFNGDGISDLVIDSGGQWAVKSGTGPYGYIAQGIQLGSNSSVPLVGDFNGDGISDFVIYDAGTWTVKSGTGPYSYVAQGITLGGSGCSPLVADFNHDGIADFVVDCGGQWAVKSGAAPYSYLAQGIQLGDATSTPLMADIDGDGYPDFIIDADGQWAVKSGVSPNNFVAQGVALGDNNCHPLTGDFNGDHQSDFVVDCSGQWAVKSGAAPYSYITQGIALGSSTDTALLGHFASRSVTDFVICSGGQWAVKAGTGPYGYRLQGVALGGPGQTAITG